MSKPDDSRLRGHGGLLYSTLLNKAEQLSARTLQELRNLDHRYPETLPSDLIDHMTRDWRTHLPERRLTLRLPDDSEATIQSPREFDVQGAVVADRSPGGFALRLDQPLRPGCVVLVRPENSDWVEAEIRHCHPAGRQWLVGCQILGGAAPAGGQKSAQADNAHAPSGR